VILFASGLPAIRSASSRIKWRLPWLCAARMIGRSFGARATKLSNAAATSR
jgi:hypothetical protein